MEQSLRETATVLASLRAAAVASRDTAYPRLPRRRPTGRGDLLRRALILADLDAMGEVLALCSLAWSVNVGGQGGDGTGSSKGRRDTVPDSEDEGSNEDAEKEAEERRELQQVTSTDDDDNDDDAGRARQVSGLLTERGQQQSDAFACLEKHMKKLERVSVVWGDNEHSSGAHKGKADAVRKARLVGFGGREVVVMVDTAVKEDLESDADASTAFRRRCSVPTISVAAANIAPETAEDGGDCGNKIHDQDTTEEQQGLAAELTERELRDLVQEINALVSHAIQPPLGLVVNVTFYYMHTYVPMVYK